MVRVRLTFKSGKSKITTFSKATLKDVKTSAPRINPKIIKVELARRRRIRRRDPFSKLKFF